MKIAVASTDGKKVDEHFGKAERFLVYELTEEGPRFVAERKVEAYSTGDRDHGFESDRFLQVADVIADCERVYVSRIGDRPAEELSLRGVKPVVYEGEIALIKG